jgi:two-component system, NtrC family, response regulator HydG
MTNTSLSDLTPTLFLQTFVLELMHASEQLGQQHCEQLIEHIARTAGCFFEETYRNEKNNHESLNRENYTELILGLKNNIGGNFSLSASNQDCITVVNSSCPFGDGVTNFPELCRMTSSVFGGIAARNFGYAKVEIKKSIARHDGCCEVCIHTNPSTAKGLQGIEYIDTAPTQVKQDIDELHTRIEEKMQKIWRSQTKIQAKKQQLPTIVAKSPSMQKVLQNIEVIAPTTAPVLINGETGVGKELIARAIHAMSDRANKPFIAINCGAIPETLIETALFGHEKGAFTGAVEVHQGYFERAQDGTLFLDEVDSLSPAAQTRLLRILQEGEMERVGGKHTLSVDVRIISATNQHLDKLVEQKLFRKDLYYRVNVICLEIPPLAERPDDLPYLVNLIVQRLNKKYNKQVESVNREVMQKIRDYPWPGNVRELENTLERSLLFTKGEEIKELELEMDLDLSYASKPLEGWKNIKDRAVSIAEQTFLQDALAKFQGDIKKVAEDMDISTRAIYNKLNKYNIKLADYR